MAEREPDSEADIATNELTPRQRRAVEEYIVHLNWTKAAQDAGYSKRSAKQLGYMLSLDPRIKVAVDEALAERSKRTQITADQVLRDLWLMCNADVNELVEHRRDCCRHCHGTNHEYQMTQREFDTREAEWKKRKGAKPTDVCDPMGGVGFDHTLEPNPECPMCLGEGEERTVFKDTRYTSRGARLLYDGVKQTKDGIEIKVLDRKSLRRMLMEHLGMFREPADDLPMSDDERAKRIRAELEEMDRVSGAASGAAA